MALHFTFEKLDLSRLLDALPWILDYILIDILVYVQSPPRTLPSSIGRPDYADKGIPIGEQQLRGNSTIKILPAADIKKMRKSSQVIQSKTGIFVFYCSYLFYARLQ